MSTMIELWEVPLSRVLCFGYLIDSSFHFYAVFLNVMKDMLSMLLFLLLATKRQFCALFQMISDC